MCIAMYIRCCKVCYYFYRPSHLSPCGRQTGRLELPLLVCGLRSRNYVSCCPKQGCESDVRDPADQHHVSGLRGAGGGCTTPEFCVCETERGANTPHRVAPVTNELNSSPRETASQARRQTRTCPRTQQEETRSEKPYIHLNHSRKVCSMRVSSASSFDGHVCLGVLVS